MRAQVWRRESEEEGGGDDQHRPSFLSFLLSYPIPSPSRCPKAHLANSSITDYRSESEVSEKSKENA